MRHFRLFCAPEARLICFGRVHCGDQRLRAALNTVQPWTAQVDRQCEPSPAAALFDSHAHGYGGTALHTSRTLLAPLSAMIRWPSALMAMASGAESRSASGRP